MRYLSEDLEGRLRLDSKELRYAVGVIYSTSSPHFTSRTLSNVTGTPVQSTLGSMGGISQQLNPDEGRSTIGEFVFEAVDVNGAATSALRTQLDSNNEGPRWREVRVFVGVSDDFTEFDRVATYQVQNVELQGAKYVFPCSDISRQLRDKIFEPKKTRLTTDLAITDGTVNVVDTSEFQSVAHTAAFGDAPSATVYYFRIKKTGEVIRATGKTATSFTGCTRERFNTTAQDIVVDTALSNDRLPEIEEYIYLQMPVPEIAYALLTGVIRSSTASPQDTLPEHWHLGIDEAYVNGAEFDDIGLDLVDPSDASKGLVFDFRGLTAEDGKQFIEEQLMFPMGCYMPIDSQGVLGLRKFARLLTDAPFSFKLNETNIAEVSSLTHDQTAIVNQVVINWNHNGSDYTRRSKFSQLASIAKHGASVPREYFLKGVRPSAQSDHVLRQIAQRIFDRYAEAPIRMSVRVLPSVGFFIEAGDVERVDLTRFRDYQDAATLNRSFEVQSADPNWVTGHVTLELFGTGREIPEEPGAGTAPALGDEFYTSEGTELSTVLTIVGGQVTADGTLTGNADLNAAGAIYYYDGDLQINPGVTVDWTLNIQLRIKGTLTVAGTLTGEAAGIAGETDPNVIGTPWTSGGPSAIRTSAYYGTTRGSDSVINYTSSPAGYGALGSPLRRGIHATVPSLALSVTGSLDSPAASVLNGLPTDLRGCRGAYGLPLIRVGGDVEQLGGDGGASGGGIAIICRGLAQSGSGEIITSGEDGGAPASTGTLSGQTLYAGAGAGGAPGAMYVFLDGNGVGYPDLAGFFTANQGASPQTGTPATVQGTRLTWSSSPGTGPGAGHPAENQWQSAHYIQYIPPEIELGDDEDEIVPAPDNLAASGGTEGVELTWDPPPPDRFDEVEVWRATTNDRSGAVLVSNGKTSGAFLTSPTTITRYFWIRARKQDGLVRGYSEWEPVSSTAGVSASYGGGDTVDPSTFVYRQSSAPGSPATGAIWIDTDDSRVYRYNGSTWQQFAADDALLLTNNAPAEANADVTGSNTAANITGQGNLATQNASDLVYRQSSAPSHQAGRIWYDTDDGRFYRSNGSTWQQIGADDPLLASFNAMGEAGADVTGSNTAANITGQGSLATLDAGDVNYRQSSDPGAVGAGRTWYDTDDGRYYRRNSSNTAWEQIGADDPTLSAFNAAAEAGADATADNLSAADWQDESTFTPTWNAGFSTAPTGDLSYSLTVDGNYARLWTPGNRHGTSNANNMRISNLPSAIQPTTGKLVMATGTVTNNTFQQIIAAFVFGATSGAVWFSILDSTPRFNSGGFATSGTKGLDVGCEFTWPMS